MPTLQSQIEKMFRDVTRGPDLTDSIEVGLMGAALGAMIGYAKDRSSRSAKGLALWGASLGIAGQYMLFQMLKPAMRGAVSAYGGRYYTGIQSGPAIVGLQSGLAIVGNGGDGMMPATGCPAGTYWSEYYRSCTPNIPPPPPPQPLPATLSDWEQAHQTSGYYTGAVKGIGGFRGGSMPFGPGPWPTQYTPDPEPW